jgi:uncharacterized membrane protein YdbT with pleckstrin-like domain
MNNKKQQQIEELTWKYFRQQKANEILIGLFWIFLLYTLLTGTFLQVCWTCFYGANCSHLVPKWILISGLICDFIWVIVGIIYWLRCNYKTAKERAEEELN